MKNTKKILIFLFSFLIISTSYGYDIEKIQVINDKTVDFGLGSTVKLADKYNNSDVKILEDLVISSSIKDFKDQSKIILGLSKDLKQNYSYSILTLFGAEGNMDFKLGNELKGVTIENKSTTGIKSINIKDSKTVEITFSSNLSGEDFEFKFLREIPIDSIITTQSGSLEAKLLEKIVEKTSYMIVAISLKDSTGNLLNFDEGIYDFKTPDTLKKSLDENPINPLMQGSTGNVIKNPDTKSPTGNTINSTSLIGSQQPPIIPTLTGNKQIGKTTESNSKNEIEKVALKVKQTPETGAETDILILLTLFLNSAYFIRKKIINK